MPSSPEDVYRKRHSSCDDGGRGIETLSNGTCPAISDLFASQWDGCKVGITDAKRSQLDEQVDYMLRVGEAGVQAKQKEKYGVAFVEKTKKEERERILGDSRIRLHSV